MASTSGNQVEVEVDRYRWLKIGLSVLAAILLIAGIIAVVSVVRQNGAVTAAPDGQVICPPNGYEGDIVGDFICDAEITNWRPLTDAERLALVEAELAELKSGQTVTTTTATATPAASSTPPAAPPIAAPNPDEFYFSIEGVRDLVPMNEVDHARGGFDAEWPALGHILAEPGKLVVGPDYPQNLIDASKGAVWREDGLNTYRLDNNDGSVVGCAEGSFVFFSGQEAHMDFETGAEFSYRAPDGSNAHVYVRCPTSDGKQGSDDHGMGDIFVSGYKPNHISVKHFSGTPAGGFVSDEGASQALEISEIGATSGSEGALTTYIVAFDPNTGAHTEAVWDGQTMTIISSNWYVAP